MESILLTEGGCLPLYRKVEAYLIDTDYTVPPTVNGGWLYRYTALND